MTAFGPNRSSARPAKIVETPATTLATIAKMMTSLGAEPEGRGREHAGEREDAGEPVAVDRAGEQEPERRARGRGTAGAGPSPAARSP